MLWEKFEDEFMIKVPLHLKFIFNIQSADNVKVLSNLNKEELDFMEEFVRSDAYAREVPIGTDLSDYYENQQAHNFHFSEADLNFFKEIKQLILGKDLNF